MELHLGIDGGGTRTTACLADGNGKILGRAEAGPSNPHKVGIAAATREIAKAARLCLREFGTQEQGRPILQSVCAGIAGSDRKSIHAPLLRWMRKHISARHHILTIDAAIALSAAFEDSGGVIIISGTGSIAYGRNSAGKLLRTGGWGIPYDDRGSGYDIGRRAVAAALQEYDGRGLRTKLTALLCRELNIKSIDKVVALRLNQQGIAALFPIVLQAASEGDRVARAICNSAAHDLAALAIALLEKMGSKLKNPRVVMSGGVFQSSALIRRAFKRFLQASFPTARIEMLTRAPVEGAIWLARTSGRKKT